jgi:hypothetical protein
MKTLKSFLILTLALVAFGCNSNDDSDGEGPTNLELLTSGKWYQESSTSETYDNCEKMTYVEFTTGGSVTLNSFFDNAGTCESPGPVSGTYTLQNDVDIHIEIDGENMDAVITSISEDELVVTTDEGTLTFDKTEG